MHSDRYKSTSTLAYLECAKGRGGVKGSGDGNTQWGQGAKARYWVWGQTPPEEQVTAGDE